MATITNTIVNPSLSAYYPRGLATMKVFGVGAFNTGMIIGGFTTNSDQGDILPTNNAAVFFTVLTSAFTKGGTIMSSGPSDIGDLLANSNTSVFRVMSSSIKANGVPIVAKSISVGDLILSGNTTVRSSIPKGTSKIGFTLEQVTNSGRLVLSGNRVVVSQTIKPSFGQLSNKEFWG